MGDEYSIHFPASITMTLSESMIVSRRCAMLKTVQSEKWDFMVFWTCSSDFKSILAVASSRARIFLFHRMALARAMNYRWPINRPAVPESRFVSSLSGCCSKKSLS